MQGIPHYPDKRRDFGKLFEHPRGDKLHVYQDKLLFLRGSGNGMVAEWSAVSDDLSPPPPTTTKTKNCTDNEESLSIKSWLRGGNAGSSSDMPLPWWEMWSYIDNGHLVCWRGGEKEIEHQHLTCPYGRESGNHSREFCVIMDGGMMMVGEIEKRGGISTNNK